MARPESWCGCAGVGRDAVVLVPEAYKLVVVLVLSWCELVAVKTFES